MGHVPDEPFNDCAEEPTSKKNGQGKGRNNSDNKDRESQKSKPGTKYVVRDKCAKMVKDLL